MTDPIIAAAQFITTQLEWLRHATDGPEPYATRAFAEIGECSARMRSIVDGPRPKKYLGPCGAEIEVEDDFDYTMVMTSTCDGDVYGVPGGKTGRCSTCGAQVDQGERAKWLDEQVGGSDLAWTARGIADAYGINPRTLRAWATDRYSGNTLIRRAKLSTYWRNTDGQLVPWVEPRTGEDVRARGDRLHYVADVKKLAAEAADRREAERARIEAKEDQRGELTTTP